MTAIDTEARAVIGEFVSGERSAWSMADWFAANRWSFMGESDEFDDAIAAYIWVDKGESTIRRERERLSVIYFGPDTAIWHTANDWDERSADASASE